ncbi:hypothetical protein DPMN_067125 [Dreissena polymorpha]|uniref:Caspase recruitment domain-containing protein n=1 Tax=Dreissena polymorpha TaxID=45954 RepID=A0A9D3Z077_DREPO|nr:hypothetical protein DPMN_067125 [Dreissena polymorpha]
MDESDRRLFQKIYLRFVDRVDSIDMLGFITCLSKHTKDTITNSQTCHNGSTPFAAQKLFDALKCLPDGLQQAAYALRKCGHKDLASEIERQQASAQHHFHETQRSNSPPVPSVHNSPSNGANSVSMSDYHNFPQDDQALRNFVGKEPSMEPEPLKIYGSHNKCSVIEQENELNKSDTENEDSYTDFTVKKNIEVEENISSVSDSDSSKIIYHQDNTEFMPTLTNNEVSIEKPERFRMVNKSPITDDKHEDASNAEFKIKLSLRPEAVKKKQVRNRPEER